MPNIKIDNQDYDLDTLSAEAKGQLISLQATEAEIQRLNIQLAIAQTARVAYANALRESLPKKTDDLVLAQGETLKFNR